GPGSGPGQAAALLVLVDCGLVLQGQADVVEPVQQSVALECVKGERRYLAARVLDHLLLEVYRQLPAVELVQPLHLRRREHDRYEADLDAVLPEDVTERGGDDDVVSRLLQAPGSVLARRAAAEVAAREQDPRSTALRPVELEAGVLRPLEEHELAEARPLDSLQELLRHDLVRIDVGPVEHGRRGGQARERLHVGTSSNSRTSTKWPAIAAAAAMAGLTR